MTDSAARENGFVPSVVFQNVEAKRGGNEDFVVWCVCVCVCEIHT